MSANDQSPVRIKIEEDYDQILVEDQQIPAASSSDESCEDDRDQVKACIVELPKVYSVQTACEVPSEPSGPPSITETLAEGQEAEEEDCSPRAKTWGGSGSLTGSMGTEVQDEFIVEDGSGAGTEFDTQSQFEPTSRSSEELYGFDHQITLGEILTYCQVMYEAIQKLDQKLEQLQAKVSSMQPVHVGTALFSQKSQAVSGTGVAVHQVRTDGCVTVDSGLPMPQLVRVGSPLPSLQGEAKKPPPLSPAPGVPSPPHLVPQSRLSFQVDVESAGKTAEKSKKGSTGALGNSPKSSRRRSSGTKAGKHKTAWLGDSRRKVRVPSSVLQKAGGAQNPRSAVRLLLRSLFPVETLTASNIMGDSMRGLKKLDPNKIAAMREWVAKKFPNFDLKENGRDWKMCVSIMNSTARYLRFEAKKHKKRQGVLSEDQSSADDTSPPTSGPTAEIDVELSDSEGDGVAVSLRAPISAPQQKSTEVSSKPSMTTREPVNEELFEYLGSPGRQVKVPRVAMSTARLRSRPELVARFLIKYLFPEHVLVRSNVYGNREHGIQALDRNKIGALREHLKDRFPWMLLEENGQDWKACVGAINSTIRKFRHDLKKGKNRKKGC